MAEEKKKTHKCPYCPPDKPCGYDWCSWNGKDADKKDKGDKKD